MIVKNPQTIKIQRGGAACDFGSIQTRLHRVQGQVGAIERMLVAKKDCLSILQQVVAARQALDKVAALILESEAQGCFTGKMNQSSANLSKIISVLFKTVK